MKTKENMTQSEIMNFNSEVVNFINDNLEFIKENAQNLGQKDLAKQSLEHYNAIVEAGSEYEAYLSDEQKEQFLYVANRLFDQGYVEYAGFLI